MVGGDAQKWKEYRSDLHSPEMAEAFSNDFLKTTGLADYTAKVSKNSVATLNNRTNRMNIQSATDWSEEKVIMYARDMYIVRKAEAVPKRRQPL